jgi:Cu(I)/Ag(I) efflux system membrane fusion protein
MIDTARGRAAVLLIVAAAAGGGFWLGVRHDVAQDSASATATAKQTGRKILYYYDPMVPLEHYDKPGLSSMGMQTQPKYAEPDATAAGPLAVTIVADAVQNLGVRTVATRTGTLTSALDVTGTVEFDQRAVAIVQARSAGFVQRTYGRAPGDVVSAGAAVADLLIPEWGGAQQEYLAVRRLGDPALTAAARQRLRLLGMDDGLVAWIERGGRPDGIVTVTTPIGGVLQTLDARPGVTLAAGQTLAQVTGLGTVWLNAAVPEVRAGDVHIGQAATAELTGFGGERFTGHVIAILPTAQADSRTLTVRVELRNPRGRLRPGMFATVHLGTASRPMLLVPSEAVIRTGTRTLVMLAAPQGRYRPAEVRVGRDAGGQTEVLEGLHDGETVVASGQFLLDSEASLTGIAARKLGVAK